MIVAEVITMISAMRVIVEKVPDPMVSMPSVRSMRCDDGTMKRYHANRNGMATNDGMSHFTLHCTIDVFSAGSLLPSMRLALISAQMPASDAQTQQRSSRLGQYVGLKNAFQNLLASCPVPATPSQVSPGVSMNVRMPLMMISVLMEAAP